jgi:hypothetical protein
VVGEILCEKHCAEEWGDELEGVDIEIDREVCSEESGSTEVIVRERRDEGSEINGRNSIGSAE